MTLNKLHLMLFRARGFTLIELMITVAVLGILAAIAYPNYEQYVRRSRIADCQTVMMEVMSFADRYFTEPSNSSSYPATTNLTARAPALLTCPRGAAAGSQQYDITMTGGSTYLITMAPTSSNVESDSTKSFCGTMTYSSANVKTSSGNKPNDFCWRR